MTRHRSGRARTYRSPSRPAGAVRARQLGTALVSAALLATTPSSAQTSGDGPNRPESSPRTAPDDPEPTGDWLRFDEIEWEGQRIEVHLRTGYERPVILPEPVALLEGQSLHGGEVAVDVEVVLFSPREPFASQDLELVGELSGTRYRLAVRSDRTGSRVPLRIVRR